MGLALPLWGSLLHWKGLFESVTSNTIDFFNLLMWSFSIWLCSNYLVNYRLLFLSSFPLVLRNRIIRCVLLFINLTHLITFLVIFYVHTFRIFIWVCFFFLYDTYQGWMKLSLLLLEFTFENSCTNTLLLHKQLLVHCYALYEAATLLARTKFWLSTYFCVLSS